MNSIHRTYYRDTSAGATFEERLQAIRGVLVPGSRIVDVGCNDGRMSLGLLKSGHASEALGIDLENIVEAKDPRFRFLQADLRETGASVVPQADAILCLNVLHHLLLAGPDFVRDFLAGLLERAETVVVDLGSLTERGPWPWRQLMGRLWASDEEVAADLFAAALWRRPLCVYRAQNGSRLLWKLSGRLPADYRFEIEARYRRTIGEAPEAKRLVAVHDDFTVPQGCSSEVIFYRLRRRETPELFWGKRYLGGRAIDWRRKAESAVIDFLRGREQAASLPVDDREDLGAVYPFDEELFRGRAVHYHDRHLLPVGQRRRYERLMSLIISGGPFAGLPVGLIADPQAIATDSRIGFFDFEPSHHSTELVAYLTDATPAQRFQVLSAFYDVNPTFAGEFPALVWKEIHEALGTDLFALIARERLRVARNREIRGGVSRLSLRSVIRALRMEAARTRRRGPAVRVALRGLLVRRR